MDFRWRGVASCFDCGVDYFDIDPSIILEDNDRKFVLCACCMNPIYVDRLGNENPQEPIRVKYHADKNVILKELCEMRSKGDSGAKNFLHEIKKMRARMRLVPYEEVNF